MKGLVRAGGEGDHFCGRKVQLLMALPVAGRLVCNVMDVLVSPKAMLDDMYSATPRGIGKWDSIRGASPGP